MSYTPISTPGATLYISATPGGSPTLEVLGVQSVDRLGTKSDPQDRTTMRDTTKVKGKSVLRDAGQISIKGLRSNQDAGQQMLKTAEAANVTYNFKAKLSDAAQLGLSNDTYFTFAALVMGFDTEPASTPGGDIMFSSSLDIGGTITEVLPS